MLEYLVTSRARRELLRRLWLDGDRGSVSELARACGLSFATAYGELKAMSSAGLALAERRGASLEYRANRRHPQARALISLVTPAVQGRAPAEAAAGDGRAGPEAALIDRLVLSHEDEEVALSIPAALWRQRDELDYGRLVRAATRRNEQHALGFYLQLTSQLSGDPRFRRCATFLRDRRRTALRPFFSPEASDAPGKQSLPLARRWGYLMSVDSDRFDEAFKRER